MKYEQYYHLEMTGHVRLNLYMHIAFMIERLMTTDPVQEQTRGLSPPGKSVLWDIQGGFQGNGAEVQDQDEFL